MSGVVFGRFKFYRNECVSFLPEKIPVFVPYDQCQSRGTTQTEEPPRRSHC